ncbi:MAG: CatA-like O-acetyltransferase [Eubacteriaceae bacterium]|nr:CatA-like O-acetyltransferase [Eubacteriaceae bacterium]
MRFTPIDLQTWPRGQMFYYFSKMAPTGYSLTVNIDITELIKTLKEADIKFFPAYLWLVTRNLNKQIEFKVAEKDGVLGYFDTLTPLYASFHEDDHTFSLMWTEYADSFSHFYRTYEENRKLFGCNHGVLCQPQTPPPANAYTVSSVPWISFDHFAVHSYENKPYFFPSVEAGKFYEKEGRIILPLSITCHHATTDGYHVKEFLTSLQEDIINFGQYL